jgi:hypothetical protein
MGVYVRPDSRFYWLWLEGHRRKERTNIPVLCGTPHEARARRLAERLYAIRMLELAEQEIEDREQRIANVRRLFHGLAS